MKTNRSLVSVEDLSTEELMDLFKLSTDMDRDLRSGKRLTEMQGKIMATLFYEPSTRTRLSFESAMRRLGGSVISVADPRSSSAAKGESLADSIRVVSSYSDLIIIRHPLEGAAKLASRFSSVPVINAGDGSGQHPTQTLLDLYTIHREFGRIDDLTITVLGDLKYGRTTHSLLLALARFQVRVNLVSPPILKVPSHILDRVKSSLQMVETDSLESVIEDTDVLYVTRIQKERFADMNEYRSVIGSYSVVRETVDLMKQQSIILHPLPRVDEIDENVDNDKRARYFEQAAYGVPVRMALIHKVLE